MWQGIIVSSITHIDTIPDVHDWSRSYKCPTFPQALKVSLWNSRSHSSSLLASTSTAAAKSRKGISTAHTPTKLTRKPSFPPPPPFPLTSSPPVCPDSREREEDILYQWRVRRKLEQAQRATATLTARLDIDGPPLLKSRAGTGYGGMGKWNGDVGHSHIPSLLLDDSVTEGM